MSGLRENNSDDENEGITNKQTNKQTNRKTKQRTKQGLPTIITKKFPTYKAWISLIECRCRRLAIRS